MPKLRTDTKIQMIQLVIEDTFSQMTENLQEIEITVEAKTIDMFKRNITFLVHVTEFGYTDVYRYVTLISEIDRTDDESLIQLGHHIADNLAKQFNRY